MKAENWPSWLLVVCVAVVWACNRTALTVEEKTPDGWRPLLYNVESVAGKRDGYRTRATFVLASPTNERLQLELVIAVNPAARLEGGEWSYHGPRGEQAGALLPIHLEFLGGQGEGASVGGQFLLQQEGQPVYRVRLPTSRVEQGYR